MDDDWETLTPFDEALDLVVLEAGTGCIVPVAGSTPIDLTTDVEPADELLVALLDSTVRLRASDGIPLEALAALHEIPVPPAFRASPWLAESRPVVLRRGTGQVDAWTWRYTPGAGLGIDHPDLAEGTEHS